MMDLVTHYMPMTHEDLGWPFIMLYFFFILTISQEKIESLN